MRRAEAVAEAVRAHARHVVLGALVAGLLAAPAPAAVALAVGVAAAVGGVALGRPSLGLLAAGAVLAGALGGHARLAALDRSELSPLLGRTVALRAVLLEAPRRRPFGSWTAPADVVAGPGRGERIVLHGRGRPVGEIGGEVAVRGRLGRLADWEAFEARRGSHAALDAVDVRPTGRRRGGVAGFVDRIRRAAEHGVSTGLPPPQAALARGMVLGQDDALDDDTRDTFRASGLAHVLAASGQNVALLALLATGALALAGASLRTRLGGALALVALYVPLAGGGPSIQRAGIMGAAALVAAMAGRPTSRLYALLLAAAATLALNPRTSGEPGWQLSFAAVMAIALVAPRVRAALVERGLPPAAAEAVAVTVAATIGTAPLMALHFEAVSLASLPANVVAAPAIAPVVWLGTVAGALAQAGAVADPAIRLVNAVAALPLGFVGLIAHVASRAPHATLPIALSAPAAGVAYAVLAGVVASRRMRLAALGAALALAAGALVLRGHVPAAPRDLTVSFLDVGQGDATLLQHDGASVLVDTGPPDGPILDRLRTSGVRRLDLLVLTHAQADHEGAAPRVLAAMPVDAVLDGGATSVAAGGDAAAGGGAARGGTAFSARSAGPGPGAVEDAVAASGARRILPAAGQVLRVGPLRLRVLWPSASPATPGADPNERAVVLLARDGPLSVLLTSDAESPVTTPLDLSRVDVLKVAHHGSDDPGLPALLERLRPRIAAIEVGRDNSYGHPNASTLTALRRAGATVLRTDRDGTIRLTEHAGRLAVTTAAGAQPR